MRDCRGSRKKLVTALRWELEEAPKNEWLERVKRENPEAPISLPAVPENAVWPHWAQFYRKALADLSCDRPLLPLGGVTPLPFCVLDSYARRYGITGEDFEIFCYIMRRLDRVCVEKANAVKR